MYSLIPTRPSGQCKKIMPNLPIVSFSEKIRAPIIGSLPMSQPMKEIDERNCRRRSPRSDLASGSTWKPRRVSHTNARLSEKKQSFYSVSSHDESESVSRTRLRARSLDREFYESSNFYDSWPSDYRFNRWSYRRGKKPWKLDGKVDL